MACSGAILLVLCFLISAANAEQRRIALVIGNSAYTHVAALTNPRNDAALIAQTLKGLGFTLIGGKALLDLDKAALDAAIESFGRDITGADVALFYYAGHGLQVHEVNWLVPINANPTRLQDLDFQMVDASLVLRQMEGAATRLNIMILDACRNNPFSGRGLRGLVGGLAQMQVPDGTVISYATQPNNVALDGTGPNSPFSGALATTMRKPGFGILETFNQTGLAVKRATGGAQQPWYSASPIDGQFFFAGPSGPAIDSGPPPPPPASLPPGADPLDFSPLYHGALNVWFSTTPYNSDKTQAIANAFHQDFPEFRLNDRAVLPAAFVADWDAETGAASPDVAFIDNAVQLNPLSNRNSIWLDWGHDRFQLNGWWVISKRTGRLDAAQAFVRWLAASPRWQPLAARNTSLSVPETKLIETTALTAVGVLRSGERAGLEALLDPDAARANDDITYPGLKVTSARPLQTFGNAHLAFTIVDVAGSSDRQYGLRHMSFIFRKRDDGWRILQLNRDALLDNTEALFSNFDEHITGLSAQPPPATPILTEPADNAELPLPVSRVPKLAWTMNADAPVSFLIEMQMNVMHPQAPPPLNPRDLTDSYLKFSLVSPGQKSYRIDAPFGVNAQPYRVRIWAMNASGVTSLSDWHAMYFTYNQPPGSIMGRIDHHSDRSGGDYADFALQSAEACRQSCGSDARCMAFSFATDTTHCWLKDRINTSTPSSTIDSGVKWKNSSAGQSSTGKAELTRP